MQISNSYLAVPAAMMRVIGMSLSPRCIADELNLVRGPCCGVALDNPSQQSTAFFLESSLKENCRHDMWANQSTKNTVYDEYLIALIAFLYFVQGWRQQFERQIKKKLSKYNPKYLHDSVQYH